MMRSSRLENDMSKWQKLFALTAVGMMANAGATFGAEPSGSPRDVPVPPALSEDRPVSKSDEHRIVGKVLRIDRARGSVELATDEGVVVVPAPGRTLEIIKAGETVSVPRAASEFPSASPRE
jgi:hypothetical protein